ncbi:class I SAM-dependent methyltransferase [soil metagenome]
MEAAEYRNIFASEDDHFYYIAVHDCILQLIEKYVANKTNLEILDAGCGTGWLAQAMSKYGNVRAIDAHDEALKFTRQRGIDAVKSTVESLPFAANTFDLLTSIDVIYHKLVADDLTALRQFYSVLKPGGTMVLRVPANDSLYTSHDRYVHTARRYSKPDLKAKLLAAGFEIERLSYCQFPLFFPAWLKARLDAGNSDEHSVIENHPRWLTSIVNAVLKLDTNMIVGGLDMPTGIGLVTVCKKPH